MRDGTERKEKGSPAAGLVPVATNAAGSSPSLPRTTPSRVSSPSEVIPGQFRATSAGPARISAELDVVSAASSLIRSGSAWPSRPAGVLSPSCLPSSSIIRALPSGPQIILVPCQAKKKTRVKGEALVCCSWFGVSSSVFFSVG